MALEYKSKTKSYSCLAKSDEKDRIEVEVGDSKQNAKFYPQVKVMRWDNECNVSIRLKDDGLSAESESKVSDKVVWTKGQKEVEFYELPASEDLPEGGFEFNIILKEKPASNVIEFTLETKGLDFFYQPELTQEEIDKGFFRPENVVGSYAVYVSENKTNYVDGKLYKAGKVMHIYRPRIEDAKGNWVWGELNIDEKKGLMTVTVPQDFLVNAVYPVRHAAGATFGYTTGGASSWSTTGNAWQGSAATGASGSATSMSFYVRDNQKSYSVKGGVIDASTKTIITNGLTSGVVVNEYSMTWKSASFPSPPTVSATAYYLGVITTNNNLRIAYDATGDYLWDYSNDYSSPTDPTDGSVYSGAKLSAYCTYTASGGGGVTVPTNVINMVIASD